MTDRLINGDGEIDLPIPRDSQKQDSPPGSTPLKRDSSIWSRIDDWGPDCRRQKTRKQCGLADGFRRNGRRPGTIPIWLGTLRFDFVYRLIHVVSIGRSRALSVVSQFTEQLSNLFRYGLALIAASHSLDSGNHKLVEKCRRLLRNGIKEQLILKISEVTQCLPSGLKWRFEGSFSESIDIKHQRSDSWVSWRPQRLRDNGRKSCLWIGQLHLVHKCIQIQICAGGRRKRREIAFKTTLRRHRHI